MYRDRRLLSTTGRSPVYSYQAGLLQSSMHVLTLPGIVDASSYNLANSAASPPLWFPKRKGSANGAMSRLILLYIVRYGAVGTVYFQSICTVVCRVGSQLSPWDDISLPCALSLTCPSPARLLGGHQLATRLDSSTDCLAPRQGKQGSAVMVVETGDTG